MRKKIIQALLVFTSLVFLVNPLFSQNTPFIEFINPLPIPDRIETPPGKDTLKYHLVASETEHIFNPNGKDFNTPIATYAYNFYGKTENKNTILGPSLAWNYKNPTQVKVTNLLSEFTTTHWHGAHVPACADGGPHQKILPNKTWKVRFDVLDESSTMWYHPHAMGTTLEHVNMGLSGMLYVEDPDEDDEEKDETSRIHNMLPTDYNVNDFPIIVQTKKFIKNPDEACAEHKYFIDAGLGIDSLMVKDKMVKSKATHHFTINGIMYPYLKVPKGVVRLRILNGDAVFVFNLGVGKAANKTGKSYSLNPAGMHLIANDGGYTDHMYPMNEVKIEPGERYEVLVDFSKYNNGDTIFFYNRISKLNDSRLMIGGAKIPLPQLGTDRPILKFIVDGSLPVSGPDPIDEELAKKLTDTPYPLLKSKRPSNDKIYNTRNKRLWDEANICYDTDKVDMVDGCQLKKGKRSYKVTKTLKNLHSIDHEFMAIDVVNDVIELGTTEQWTIINNSAVAHPFHIHDIHFWVNEIKVYSNRDDAHDRKLLAVYRPDTVINYNVVTNRNDRYSTLPTQEDLYQLFGGPKDNVMVLPGWELSFIGTFDDFGTTVAPQNSYMYHCHILSHEEKGMMGQFVVFDKKSVIPNPHAIHAVDGSHHGGHGDHGSHGHVSNPEVECNGSNAHYDNKNVCKCECDF